MKKAEPVFLFLLCLICILSANTLAAQETPEEMLQRYEETKRIFMKEAANAKAVPMNFYYYSSRRRGEKEKFYPVCWSFETFEGTGWEHHPGENNIIYIVVDPEARNPKGARFEIKTKQIIFPDVYFPMAWLQNRKELKKKFANTTSTRSSRYYSGDSGNKKIYCVLVPRCDKLKLKRFYDDNIAMPMSNKISELKEQLEESGPNNNSSQSPSQNGSKAGNTPQKKKKWKPKFDSTKNSIKKYRFDSPVNIVSSFGLKNILIDGYNFSIPREGVVSQQLFSPPFAINATITPIGNNQRIKVCGGEIIFNWERNNNSLRVDMPPGVLTSNYAGDYGFLSRNTDHQIEITVQPDKMSIRRDGEIIVTLAGYFDKFKSYIGFYSCFGGSFILKECTVSEIKNI